MPLTAQHARELGCRWARHVFRDKKGVLDKDDLQALFEYLDAFYAALPSALGASKTILENAVAGMPEPFKSATTNQEKRTAAALYHLDAAGLLDLFD